MGKSSFFEIVLLRRLDNTAACSSKRGIARDFSLIGARIDCDNRKLEIYPEDIHKNSLHILQRHKLLRGRYKIY